MTTTLAAIGDFNGLAVAIFAVVLATTLVITWWAAKRNRSATDFYTAGRGVAGAFNGIATAGDYLSASTFLGYAGLMYLFGFDGWIIGLGAMLSFLPVLYLLADRMRNAGKFTVADVLSYRLRRRPVRIAVAINTLLICGIYLTAQLVGAGSLIEALAGISFAPAVLICGIFMVVYVVFGGMLATTWVQIIKAGMLMTAGVIISVAVLAKFNFSPSELLNKAAAEHPEGKAILGPGTYLTTPALVISTGLTIFIGTAGLPHILMRFFTVPDSKAARVSVVWTISIIAIFTALVTVMGFGARAILGGGAEEAVGKGGNLAAPLLAQSLGGGEGTTGGDIALALFSAAAFATILAVVAGLVIAASGADRARPVGQPQRPRGRGVRAQGGAHRGRRRGRRGDRRHAARGHRLQRHGAREHGLRVRGQRELPAADPRPDLAALQHDGRARGRRLRHRRLGGHDRPQPAGVAGPGLAGLALVADLPGSRHDPDRLPRLLAGDDARRARQRGRALVRRAARALGDRPGRRGRPDARAAPRPGPRRRRARARAGGSRAAAPARRPASAPRRAPRCGAAT